MKLVKESFDYFSDEFRDKVVERIKARTCVVNKDAL